jgi:hypothetical protein
MALNRQSTFLISCERGEAYTRDKQTITSLDIDHLLPLEEANFKSVAGKAEHTREPGEEMESRPISHFALAVVQRQKVRHGRSL